MASEKMTDGRLAVARRLSATWATRAAEAFATEASADAFSAGYVTEELLAEVDRLRALNASLVATLPRCSAGIYSAAPCGRLATASPLGRSDAYWCDVHCPSDAVDLPWAALIRDGEG